MITLLDYGAGNVRSIINSLKTIGTSIKMVKTPEDITAASKIIFPGVGAFGTMMEVLNKKNYTKPLLDYLQSDRPFLGICLGMQALLEGSEESPECKGLCFFKGSVKKFKNGLSVPHIGWNGINTQKESILFKDIKGNEKFYFVHSYYINPENKNLTLTTTDYGNKFVSAIAQDNIMGTQFHPEKSGRPGLKMLKNFVSFNHEASMPQIKTQETKLSKRIIACLDVRADDDGELVVTKGDQYDVRHKGLVRNLGSPIKMAQKYYEDGADEITFLNITGYRDFPLNDLPMLEVLKKTSKNVFIPLTIGGGIKDYTDSSGKFWSALDVASAYFRAGADKVSIGSDSVYAAIAYLSTKNKTGKTPIEQISRIYGSQAVVVSIDPRRKYIASPELEPDKFILKTNYPGPQNEQYCYYECTVKGGREGSNIDAVTLAKTVEELGAGEILLNCIDKDGTNSGFDIELIDAVKKNVSIPVIASSGAGNVSHFEELFKKTSADAALAAGIFHREEVLIQDVKKYLKNTVEIRED